MEDLKLWFFVPKGWRIDAKPGESDKGQQNYVLPRMLSTVASYPSVVGEEAPSDMSNPLRSCIAPGDTYLVQWPTEGIWGKQMSTLGT